MTTAASRPSTMPIDRNIQSRQVKANVNSCLKSQVLTERTGWHISPSGADAGQGSRVAVKAPATVWTHSKRRHGGQRCITAPARSTRCR
jgi:hypothetical protein